MSSVALGDGIAGMLELEPGCASLVLSDLPSGETRAEFDRPAELSLLWPAIWHALRPDGVAALMAHSFAFAAEVLDPYAGSGSTLSAAVSEGRRAMGWDISPRFGVARSA